MKRFFTGLVLFLLVASQPVFSAIAIDNISSNNISNGSSFTVSHTTSAGSDRFMLVGISLWNEDFETVTSVTYSGQSLTYVGAQAIDDDSRVEIWKLLNPPVTTSNVQIIFNETVQRNAGAGVITFTGVDQANPHDAFQGSSADSAQASITLASATNNLVFAVAASEQQDAAMSISLGDQRWNYKASGNNTLTGAGATIAGSASTTLRWNLNSSEIWSVGAVSINPASGGVTPLPSPVLDYRFDECSLASGVTDSAGSYDGTANGNTETIGAEFQINRSLNLSATGTSDYVTVDSTAVNGLNDFSISTWIKTATSKPLQDIFQALGNNVNDDEIEIYLNNSNQVRMTVGDQGTTVNAGKSLTDDNWHHLVVTRAGIDMCLYVDGNLAGCHNSGAGSQVSINNSSAVIIGQEQDAFGGNFNSSQAFEGYIDEFKIYSQVLSGSHVNTIYQNELNGDNADGSARAAVNCPSLQWEGGSVDVTVGVAETINFRQTYTDPVIFLMAENSNPDPTGVRVVSISPTTAQIIAVEPPNNDQAGTETVKFLIAEKGTFDLAGGVNIEVGEVDVSAVQHGSGVSGSASWQTINFSQNFSATPVLLTQIMSSNNGSGSFTTPWVYSASRNLRSNQFQAAIGRAEVGAGSVTQAESYAYLAVDSGALPDLVSTLSGATLTAEAVATGDRISGNCTATNLTQTYTDPPDYVAAINSLDGPDGGWVRGCSSTTTTVSVEIDEDTYRDSDRNHTNEDVGIVAFTAVDSVPIIAEYRFDEAIWNGIADEVLDSSGNDLHGIAQGNAQPVPGLVCNAASFNGSNWVEVANDALLEVGDKNADYSVSFWLNIDSAQPSGWRKILHKGSTNTERTFAAWLLPNNDNRIHHRVSTISNADDGHRSISAVSANTWTMITLVKEGNKLRTYLNGTLDRETTLSSDTVSNSGPLYIGKDRWPWNNGIRGLMDELLVFNRALPPAEIQSIRTNHLAGNNWDGTARAGCGPVAEWRFDESAWGGAGNEVEDNIDNNDGTAVGGAVTTLPGQICRAGDFDGANDYVGGLDLSQLQTTASLSFWIKTTQVGHNRAWLAPGVAGIEQSGGTDDIFWGWLDASGRIGLNALSDATTSKSSIAINDDNWHHVVLTRNAANGAYQIFIDGNLNASGTGIAGDIGNSFSSLGRIEDTGGSPTYFDGLLDEVMIFGHVLNATQVSDIYANQNAGNNWDGTTRTGCILGPDHYSISHGGSGVTCLSEQITITAHDASHSAIDAGQSTITLTTNSGLGDWVSIVSGGGSLVNGTANDGTATYTFANGSSSVVLEFSHTTVATLDFNVTDGSVSETTGSAVAADDPPLAIASSALKFVNAAGAPVDIATLISAKNNSEVYLRGVEADITNPAACSSAFAGNQSIGFAATCENPSTCVSGQRFFINGNPINVLNSGSALSYTGVNINFDANAISTQPITLNYEDAGLMRLNVNLTAPAMVGQSNDFIVRPFAFGFPAITAGAINNGAGDETGGARFTSAGSNFDVSLNAYRYQSADDSNNDNIPDAGVDVTNNGVTPNFTGTLALTIDSYSPAAGVQGNLTGTTTPLLDTYANRGGAHATSTLQYDEVGSVSILAQMDDYLGDAAADITSAVTKIGRFYPDYIALSDTQVSSSCSGFIYMQQPFSEVAYRLEARAANHDVTENYDIGLYNTEEVEFAAENNDDGNNLNARLTTAASLSGWSGGVIDRTATGIGVITDLTFTRNGGAGGLEGGPFEQLQLGIYIDQASGLNDGVNLESGALNYDPDTAGNCGASCSGAELGGTFEARYGRLNIQSAHGPENALLPVPFSVQYWDGAGFVTAVDDSCSLIPLANISFDGNSIDTVANRTVTIASGTTTGSLGISGSDAAPSMGDYGLEFSAPGEGNTGYFNVGITNLSDWLRYDWNQDGSANDLSTPDALITFGRARGNDRMIFWQERYK